MNNQKITIIGAGLSGSLLAIKMAKRGFDVEVYEYRPDMRKTDISAGKSINLAFSNRGINAIDSVGLVDKVLATAVPMHARLIHSVDGSLNSQPYSGRKGEWINSISRGGLNCILMDEAERLNVQFYFEYKCLDVDFENAEVKVQNLKSNETKIVKSDVIFGTDGAGSIVRKAMFNQGSKLRFSYSQHYLDHGYKELHIPPGEGNSFRIEKNALHIWPRASFMMIALPNFDGSFTVTLFLPFEGENGFEYLNSEERVQQFFENQFSDSIQYMPTMIEDYFKNPTGKLATVKCFPYQVKGKSLLIGDAAHAVVPFYGQGMNASFEDCIVLDKYIDIHGTNWEKVFKGYQNERKKDADAIGDLAEENFYEMRDHVADPVFMKKRKLETALEQNYPEYYSKYSMVTFKEELPYSIAMQKGRAQDKLLMDICAETDDIAVLNHQDILSKVAELQ